MNPIEARRLPKSAEKPVSRRRTFLQRAALAGVLFTTAAMSGASARADAPQPGIVPAPVSEQTAGCPFGETTDELQGELSQKVGGKAELWEIKSQQSGRFEYTADDDAAELVRPITTGLYNTNNEPIEDVPALIAPHESAILDCNFFAPPNPNTSTTIFLKRN